MEQERGQKHKRYQPADSQNNTWLFVGVADTIHRFHLNDYLPLPSITPRRSFSFPHQGQNHLRGSINSSTAILHHPLQDAQTK
tara:strand:+ start:130 stop:378 length:249 start_codon:yes stop_codon:yes gene_type:complete